MARVADELGRVDLLVNNAGLIDAAEVPRLGGRPRPVVGRRRQPRARRAAALRAVVPGMLAARTRPGGQPRQRHGHPRQPRLLGLLGRQDRPDAADRGAGPSPCRAADVHAFDVAPGVVDTPMTRSMHDVAGLHRLDPAGARGRAGRRDRRRRAGRSGRAASCGPARTTSTPCGRLTPRTPPASCACSPTGTTTRSADGRRRRSEDRGQRPRGDVDGDRGVRVQLDQLAVQLQGHGRERREARSGWRWAAGPSPRVAARIAVASTRSLPVCRWVITSNRPSSGAPSSLSFAYLAISAMLANTRLSIRRRRPSSSRMGNGRKREKPRTTDSDLPPRALAALLQVDGDDRGQADADVGVRVPDLCGRPRSRRSAGAGRSGGRRRPRSRRPAGARGSSGGGRWRCRRRAPRRRARSLPASMTPLTTSL